MSDARVSLFVSNNNPVMEYVIDHIFTRDRFSELIVETGESSGECKHKALAVIYEEMIQKLIAFSDKN